MVASRESFITLTLSGIPSIHMGDESKIISIEKGLDKIQHVEFKNGVYVPSPTTKKIVENEEEEESSTQSIWIEESLLGVTPSPAASEVYEIFDISSPHMDNL